MNHYPKKGIYLTSGRRLSYEDVGDRGGLPVFYFHGVPGASVEWRMWGSETLLQLVGIRLIVMDRPGVGSSDFQPNRRISDWPADVVAVADTLGLPKFSVLGYSGGGPYAAVCARKIPERLNQVALVSSLAPFSLPDVLEGVTPDNVRFLNLSRQKPWMYRLIYGQMGLMTRLAPRRYLRRALSTFAQADREAFERPEVHSAVMAARGSPRGQQLDTALIITEWDFNLREISIPVHVWQGEQDHNASQAMYRYLVDTIPQTQARLVPGEGHISLIVNHAEEILRGLL